MGNRSTCVDASRSGWSWLALPLTLLLCLSAGCQTAHTAASPAGCESQPCTTHPASAGIENFGKVSDSLYRGGQPTNAGYETLSLMDIRTIVTLRLIDRESDELRKEGFQTFHISFKHVHPETEDVLKFLTIVTAQQNQPVFVHCREGEDRTGMMVAVYRMVIQNWPKNKAIREMKQMGFNHWNQPIERYLRKMDVKHIRQQLAAQPVSDLSNMDGME